MKSFTCSLWGQSDSPWGSCSSFGDVPPIFPKNLSVWHWGLIKKKKKSLFFFPEPPGGIGGMVSHTPEWGCFLQCFIIWEVWGQFVWASLGLKCSNYVFVVVLGWSLAVFCSGDPWGIHRPSANRQEGCALPISQLQRCSTIGAIQKHANFYAKKNISEKVGLGRNR